MNEQGLKIKIKEAVPLSKEHFSCCVGLAGAQYVLQVTLHFMLTTLSPTFVSELLVFTNVRSCVSGIIRPCLVQYVKAIRVKFGARLCRNVTGCQYGLQKRRSESVLQGIVT